MKYHALLVFFWKKKNLKLSSAASYRWRFKNVEDMRFGQLKGNRLNMVI